MAYLNNFNPEKVDSVPEVRNQLRFLRKAIDNKEIGGGGGEGDFPLEIHTKFSELTQEPLVVNVEYNKWYFILVNCPLIIKLPEIATGVVKELMITCALLAESPEVIFVPAKNTDSIYEQLDASVDSLGFYEFSCAASTVSILGSPRPSWFISNTRFDNYPTSVSDDIYAYLESLENGGASGGNDESSDDNSGPTITPVDPGTHIGK